MKRCLSAFQVILVLLTITACSSSLPDAAPTPTLTPGMGRISGVLQVRSGESAQAVKGALLYLGETVKDSTGTESLAAYDRASSPRAITDGNGRFAFSNIKPGRYGLFLDTVVQAYLLQNPDSGATLLFEVSAGTEVDAGTLLYDSLPLLSPQPPAYPYP